MEIKFSKYHGLGNDFIIIDAREDVDYPDLAREICDRHFGVGADGLIVYQLPQEMLFYNADGSVGTMCGNGLRCLSRYLRDEKNFGDSFTVETAAGSKLVRFIGELIETDLGVPDLSGKRMGIAGDPADFIDRELEGFTVSAVFTGAAHLVVFCDDPFMISTEVAARLSNHPVFTDRINLNFVKAIDRATCLVRTYERGVGWTEACGTGAAAVYVETRRQTRCDEQLTVRFRAGAVRVRYEGGRIVLTGPAERIANGVFYRKKR